MHNFYAPIAIRDFVGISEGGGGDGTLTKDRCQSDSIVFNNKIIPLFTD